MWDEIINPEPNPPMDLQDLLEYFQKYGDIVFYPDDD